MKMTGEQPFTYDFYQNGKGLLDIQGTTTVREEIRRRIAALKAKPANQAARNQIAALEELSTALGEHFYQEGLRQARNAGQ